MLLYDMIYTFLFSNQKKQGEENVITRIDQYVLASKCLKLSMCTIEVPT